MDSVPSAEHVARQNALRVVNVRQVKTHRSRLIDAAHAGETILLASHALLWWWFDPCPTLW